MEVSIASIAAQEQAWNRQQLAQPVVAPQWRVWTYEQPALVLGCSQRAWHERLTAAPGGPPMEVLLRESGGGAVLTGPWLLGLSLVLPPGHAWLAGGLLPSYQRLGELHVGALEALGISARAVAPQALDAEKSKHEADPLGWACFGGLSPWEVVDAQGRKLVGLAQRRRQTGVLLVAGTLLSPPDWPLLCAAMDRPHDAAVLHERTVSCAQLQGRPLAAQTWSTILLSRLAQALR